MTDQKKIQQIAILLYNKHWGGNLSTWTFEEAEKHMSDTEGETFTQEAQQIATLYESEPQKAASGGKLE